MDFMSSAPACPEQDLTAQDAVTSYKSLAKVERAFRSLKSMDLRVRPIHHSAGESG